MTDAGPTVEKVTAEPVSATESTPVTAPASTPAPPADMAVESNPVDGKLKDKVEVADAGAESSAAKKEINGAPEAVMQEPKPIAAPQMEKEPKEAEKKNEKAGSADKAKAAEANGDFGDVEMKDAVEPESKTEPETGHKRKANQQANTNGSNGNLHEETVAEKSNDPPEVKAPAPAGKKQKTNGAKEPAPVRNASRGKKQKKHAAPVGKTARRTRSQGLA